jgi:hypothetical protein
MLASDTGRRGIVIPDGVRWISGTRQATAKEAVADVEIA